MTVKSVIPNRLVPTKQPALVLSPDDYVRQYQDALNNILRLYFTQIDNVTGNLLTNEGGRFLGFPHIAAADTTDQYAKLTPQPNNNPTVVKWNTLESSNSFTLNNDNTATPLFPGIYKIDYSLQVANSASQLHELFVWLQLDGVDVVDSGRRFSIHEAHGGVDGFLVAYSSVTFIVPAESSVGLVWAADVAATADLANTGVYLHAESAQVSPFPMPAIPSAIGSITFVSSIPA